MAELEWEWRWIGTFTRENQTLPVLHLRQRAQRLGLMRSRRRDYHGAVAYGLNALGYAERNGDDVSATTAGRLLRETWDLFVDFGVFEPGSRKYRNVVRVTDDGRAFARAALAG